MWGRLLLFAAVVLAAACGNTDPSAPGNSSSKRSADSTTVRGEKTELWGTKWRLEELGGRKLIEGTKITLTFQNEGLAGNAGCNSYRATGVKLGKETIETSTISATEMACGKTEGGVMSQEQRYLRAMGGTASYKLAGDRLEVRNGAEEKTLIFEKEHA